MRMTLMTRFSWRKCFGSNLSRRERLRAHSRLGVERLEGRLTPSSGVGLVASNGTQAVGIFNPLTNSPIATIALPGGNTTGATAITADQKLGFVTQFNST